MKYMDYLFLRIYSWYEKREPLIPLFASRCFLTTVVTVSIIDLFLITERIGGFKIPSLDKIEFLLIMVIIFGFVYFLYTKKRILKIETKYGNESKKLKRKRGWLIVGYLLLIILYPIILGEIHNH